MKRFKPNPENPDKKSDYQMERDRRNELLINIKDYIFNPDSKLQETSGLVENYDTETLASYNYLPLGGVRVARFTRGGAFVSAHIDYTGAPLQVDLTFTSMGRTALNLTKLEKHPGSDNIHSPTHPLHYAESIAARDDFENLALPVIEALENESSGRSPWNNAYSPLVLARAKRTSGLLRLMRAIHPDEISVNPATGEPYL